MSLCKTTIDQADIVHFVSSVKDIFKKMLGWEIEPVEFDELPIGETVHDVSGVIGLAGSVRANDPLSQENFA